MLLPAGEFPCGGEAIAGNALAVTAVVTFVDLTFAASELGQTAAQFAAIFTLQTCSFVEAVTFTTPCSHTNTFHMSQQKCLNILVF